MSNLCRIFLIAFFSVTAILSFGQSPASKKSVPIGCEPKGPDGQMQVHLTQCSPYALGSYPDNRCFVTINRAAPASPQAITLPPGTRVCIALHNPRPTEGVQFQPTISNIPAPDLGSTFLPNLSPLQSLGFIAGQVSQSNSLAISKALLGPSGYESVNANLSWQSSFELLAPAQRTEALLVAASAGTPVQFSASQMVVVETAETLNTSALASILKALPEQPLKNLQDASKAVTAAHELQGLNVDVREKISNSFSVVVVKGYAGSTSKDLVAVREAASLSLLLTGDVNELLLAKELFSLGRRDSSLLAGFKSVVAKFTVIVPTSEVEDIDGELRAQLDDLDTKVANMTSAITHAGNMATCFLQYSATTSEVSSLIHFEGETGGSKGVVTCNTQTLDLQKISLKDNLQPIYNDLKTASNLGLLQGNSIKLNTIVTDGLKQCAQQQEKNFGISATVQGSGTSSSKSGDVALLQTADCNSLAGANDRLASIQSRITLLSSLQGPLQQAMIQLERLPQEMHDIYYELPITGRVQKGYTTASVAIVVQPLISLTTSPPTSTIATVIVTYGAGRYRTFTTSTGLAFLLGKAANYSVQQQATNSSTGTSAPGSLCSGTATGPSSTTGTYCVVNSPSSSPQILAPAVYLHYLLFGAKGAPFQIGVHLSGGVGLDLTPVNKSASFMAGVSLQIGSVMITPALTFVEDQRLTGGYTTQQLYTTTGTVPTNIVWPKKLSVGITYVIPTLSSASPASPASSPSSSPNSGASGSAKKSH